MGFLGGLVTGSNPTLSKDIDAMGGLGTFLSNTGSKDVGTASTFMNTLLSGNSGQVSTLLAPQIEGIQKRNQQTKQQLAEFGGRSGGTTGAMLASDDDVHAQINDLVAKLTGSAVNNLGTLGSNLVAQGAGDLNSEAALSQQRLQNMKDSILGKGLSTAAGAAEAYGLGGVGGMLPGGVGAAKGAQSALASFLG